MVNTVRTMKKPSGGGYIKKIARFVYFTAFSIFLLQDEDFNRCGHILLPSLFSPFLWV